MTDYFIEYHEMRHNIGGYDPSDSWSRDSYESDYDVLNVYLSQPDNSYNTSVEKVYSEYNTRYGYDDIEFGEDGYLVIVHYSTGDTFGRNDAIAFPAFKKDANAAQEVVDAIEAEKHFDEWSGYFEYVKSVTIERFTVRNS